MLGANFPSKFVEDFWENAAPDGTAKNLIVKCMAKLWLDLPNEVRRTYLYPIAESDKAFFTAIESIIDKKLDDKLAELRLGIQSGKKAQEFEDKVQKHKDGLRKGSKAS
jgi:hypothetical protein